jgi:hypothetical protein
MDIDSKQSKNIPPTVENSPSTQQSVYVIDRVRGVGIVLFIAIITFVYVNKTDMLQREGIVETSTNCKYLKEQEDIISD